jgi:hypothetical protein
MHRRKSKLVTELAEKRFIKLEGGNENGWTFWKRNVRTRVCIGHDSFDDDVGRIAMDQPYITDRAMLGFAPRAQINRGRRHRRRPLLCRGTNSRDQIGDV